MDSLIAYENDFPIAIFKVIAPIYLAGIVKITQDSNQDCRKAGRRLYQFLKKLCIWCDISLRLQGQMRGIEDVILKEGISKMWWEQ